MSLADIADVLEGHASDIAALRDHRDRLLAEKQRIDAQVQSVESTIIALEKGRPMMPHNMFDGFDHKKYDAEVRQRWGDVAADRSNSWWKGLGAAGRTQFMKELEELNASWDEAIAAGVTPDSAQAQEVAALHVTWLGAALGDHRLSAEKIKGIVQMYVDDERFAANYNRVSQAGPQFVRDAVHYWVDQHYPIA